MSEIATGFALAVALALLLAAALHDLAWRMIPNCLPTALAIDGIVLRLLSGQVLVGMAAGAGVFAAATLLWRRGLMGGGDVKLLGAASIVVPPGLAAAFVLAVTLAGGLLAMTYLALRCVVPRAVLPPRRPRAARLVRLALVEQRRIRQCRSLPYACAIAAGALFVLIRS